MLQLLLKQNKMKSKIKYIIVLFMLVARIGYSQTIAPAGVLCTALSTTSIKVDWSCASTSNVVGFTVAYGTVTGFNSSTTYRWVSGAAMRTYTITNLLANTKYFISVKAEGSSDTYDSPFATFNNCTTLTGGGTTGTTPAPTNLSGVALSASSIKVTWLTPAITTNIVGYTLARNTTAAFSGATYTWSSGVSTVTCTISGLNAGTLYYFAIKAEGTSDTYDSPFTSFVSCTTQAATTPTPTPTPTPVGSVHQYNKIVVVIGENTNASAVFGSADAPYINSLANNGAKFTNSFALARPSQPNYLMLFSGSAQGVTSNNMPGYQFTTPNLARALMDAGKSFCSYSEDLPSVGWNGASSGGYERKHNPVANWMGTGTNQVPATLNQPWYAFPSNYNNLPSVSFVIPNQCNDGHNLCPPYNNRTKQYDAWLQNYINDYAIWCKANNSLLIVTYDEDDFTTANKISTVFYGAYVMTGTYSQTINHYNVLRTIEDAFSLSTHAGQAANVSPISYCWQANPFVVTNPGPISQDLTVLSTEYIGTDFVKYDSPYSELPKNKMLVEIKHMSDGTIVRSKFIVRD